MSTILAIDLGTKTGFALAGPRELFMSGEWDFKPSRHEGAGMRDLKFRRKLAELHAAVGVTEVWYEAVEFTFTSYQKEVLSGLRSTLIVWCEENKIPYRGVPVATLKKFATGRGSAKKARMLLAARGYGYDVPDGNDNEADALCLLQYAITEGLFGS